MQMSKDLCCKSALQATQAESRASILMDSSGDFFGSYRNDSNDNVEMGPGPSFNVDCNNEDDSGNGEVNGNGSNSELEESDVDKNEEEGRMEPKRPDCSYQEIPDNETDPPDSNAPHNQQGEAALTQEPYVVKFPSLKAGQAYHQGSLGTNHTYTNHL